MFELSQVDCVRCFQNQQINSEKSIETILSSTVLLVLINEIFVFVYSVSVHSRLFSYLYTR